MPPYFHGSITDQIQQFHPFSHFGTFEQALSVIVEKKGAREKGIQKGPFPLAPTMYEVEIDQAALANPLKVADWGTPKVIGIARAMREAFGKEGADCTVRYGAFAEIRAHLHAQKNNTPRWRMDDDERFAAEQALQEEGWRLLTAEMQRQGWTCLTYSNIVEGGERAPTFCVPDPRHLSIVSLRPTTEAELRSSKRQVKHL
jgi:hypothetical protein